jgi:hypothetical protein
MPRRMLIGAAVLLLVAAATLPDGSPFGGGSGRGDRLVVPELPDFFYLVLFVMIMAIGVIGALIVRPLPRDPAARRSRMNRMLVLLFLIAFLVTLSPIQRLVAEAVDVLRLDDPGDPGSGTFDESRVPDIIVTSSQILGVVLTGILVLVMVGMSTGMFVLYRRERPIPAGADEALLEEIESSISELEKTDDPRRAVIACFARMRVLAGAPPSDTADESLARLLTEHDVSRPSAARLTELFQQAKFSTHDIHGSMRDEAVEALQTVRTEIEAARGETS